MYNFNLKRDFKFIVWKSTLQVTVVRAIASGPVWFIIMLLTGQSFPQALLMLVGFPIAYILFFMPLGMLCGFLSKMGLPIVGLLTIAFSFMIVLADPIVYFIHKSNPKLVPVKEFGFFNFCMFIYVIDEERQKAALGIA